MHYKVDGTYRAGEEGGGGLTQVRCSHPQQVRLFHRTFNIRCYRVKAGERGERWGGGGFKGKKLGRKDKRI